MSKTRAQRRHDEARVVKNRVKSHRGWGPMFKHVAKTTGKPCSCELCCNKRRAKSAKPKDQLTMQERRLAEELNQLYSRYEYRANLEEDFD